MYIGVTNDLIRRTWQHKQKFVEGFTKKYYINKLVYYEQYENVEEAIKREKQLKAGSRRKKVELIIKMNPKWEDLWDEII